MPNPSPELRQLLRETFGIDKPKKRPENPAPLPIHDEPQNKPKRELPDMSIGMAAQRIFNPSAPPAPPIKGPTNKMLDQGTAANLDLKSKWDKGNE